MLRFNRLFCWLVVVGGLFLGGGYFFLLLLRADPIPRGERCRSNLKQLGMAIMQYAQDYDEKYPLVAGTAASTNLKPYHTPYGWADALYPYYKNTAILHCPSPGFQSTNPDDSTLQGFTDYWFNRHLSGVKMNDLESVFSTLAVGEGKEWHSSGDARYAIGVLSQDWRTRSDSPLQSHRHSANYLFADGHARWYTPNAIQNWTLPSLGLPTFRVKK